jgi:RNA polymerase sigma factor (sigma-70 family)
LNTQGETPNQERSLEPLLLLWEAVFKQLVFIEYAHLADNALTFYQGQTSQTELDDLRQDALVQLWEFIDETITCSDQFKKDAARVINTRLHQARRSSLKQCEVAHELKKLNHDAVPSPSQHLENLEITRILNEALQNLDRNRAKTIAKLHGLGDFDKLRVNQVADDLNISRQTVRNRRDEAYNQLRKNKNLQSLMP